MGHAGSVDTDFSEHGNNDERDTVVGDLVEVGPMEPPSPQGVVKWGGLKLRPLLLPAFLKVWREPHNSRVRRVLATLMLQPKP